MSDYLFAVPCRCGGRAIVRDMGGVWAVDCASLSCSRSTVKAAATREAAVREWNEMQRETEAPKAYRCAACGLHVNEWVDNGYFWERCGCLQVGARYEKQDSFRPYVREMHRRAIGICGVTLTSREALAIECVKDRKVLSQETGYVLMDLLRRLGVRV